MLPDATLLVTGYLRASLGGVPVYTAVPSTRPLKFVRVWRTGGVPQSRVLDYAQMTVECWGGTQKEAADLGRLAHEKAMNAASSEGIALCRRVESGALYYDPDPSTKHERYTFTAFFRLRAPVPA